jgi:hypothetical protein
MRGLLLSYFQRYIVLEIWSISIALYSKMQGKQPYVAWGDFDAWALVQESLRLPYIGSSSFTEKHTLFFHECLFPVI